MESKIREEIENIKKRIEWKQRDLEKSVKDFREVASVYDAYHIETFIPGKIEDIARYRADLAKLAEQKQMLEYMLN